MSDIPNDTNAKGAIKLAQNFADKSFSGHAILAIAETILYLADVIQYASLNNKTQEQTKTDTVDESAQSSDEHPWYYRKRPYEVVEGSEKEWKRAFIQMSYNNYALKDILAEIAGKCISVDDPLVEEIAAISKKALDNDLRASVKGKAREYLSRADNLEVENTRLREALDAATDAIAFTVACCTYGSEEQAKVGAYGISHEAFTKIDAFIRKYALDKGEALNRGA